MMRMVLWLTMLMLLYLLLMMNMVVLTNLLSRSRSFVPVCGHLDWVFSVLIYYIGV